MDVNAIMGRIRSGIPVQAEPRPEPEPAPQPLSVSFQVPSSARAAMRRAPSGFTELFSPLVGTDLRTKPSYTDCWLAGVPEMRTVASYMTDVGSVRIGMTEGGEAVYCVTPREYAYPDALNAVVMDVIDEIRDGYRREGGSLDRDTVMGMTRSVLTDRWDEIAAASGSDDTERVVRDICGIAYRHSVGAGIFEVLLSDGHIEDVYVDAPCSSNRIHVTVNGIDGLNSHIRCSTNLMAEEREVDNLVNILKRCSGLRFCRASPVLETDMSGFDARATVIGYPLSPNGNAVAIRKRSVRPWTLSRLVANGTVSPRAAGILSFLVDSRATILVCGARGAGKSSLLSALMFEFPLSQRILTIEDTIELPGDAMRSMGYKVQTILVDERLQGSAASRADEALRVSLRLGESAIVMGEVRGEEARTLYQSMRAGRAGSAVMGTVHGDSAESVYKRMVFDVGIPPEAFMATDVIVTMDSQRDRRSGSLVRRTGELKATGDQPGEFVDVSGPDGLLNAPFARRAMKAMRMSERDAAKDIRARSIMRQHLASLGTKDEGFLGPEWIILANEVLSSMPPGSSAEDALAELKRRIGA
ncbi:MAG: ATPase, T2SS/T4P/T4SS family [Thermoplasmata archaeon]|nr:ATPase, T2SS/T4P/T4SS family [Thermoplasmata archaeon]